MAKSRVKASVRGLTKVLLITLGTGAIITVALAFPGLGFLYREFKRDQWDEAKKRGAMKSTIKRLEKQKLISWRENEKGEVQLTLTEDGQKRVLRYKIDELNLSKKKKDGFLRVVIFDIPEKDKAAREVFRRKLKEMGFYKLQRSVFITPYKCKSEIDFLSHSLGVAPHVHYIVAKSISGIKSE